MRAATTTQSASAIEPTSHRSARPSGDQVINDDGSRRRPDGRSAATDGHHRAAWLVDPAPDRLLIVEVTVGVEVVDVGSTVSDVIAISRRYGGQIYGSDVRLTDPESSSGTIVVKLPPENVEAMIADVSALGRQVSRLQSTDDVTDRVTDLETRIATAQESVERVQRLLADAKDLGEVVLLESELTTRQTTLEQLLAEQRNLGNRTALATLTFELSTASGRGGLVDRRRRAARRRHRRCLRRGWPRVRDCRGRSADLHRLHRTVPGGRVGRRRYRVDDQSSAGTTKSISCSTAPTSSGRRSANDRTRFRRRGQKLTGSAPRAAQMPSFHG